MGKRTEGIAVLGSLLAVGGLCLVATAAHAASISIGTATIAQGGQGAVTVSLANEGSAVAGTQNDIAFDADTPVAVKMTCLRTTTQTCTTDADCPLLDESDPSAGNEPCMARPDCTVTASGKEAFFSLLKTAGCTTDCTCTGAECTALRVLVLSVSDLTPIPDGDIYSCNFAPTAGATEGDHALTASRVILSDADGMPVCSPTGTACGSTDGMITVTPSTGTPYTVCDVDPSSGDTAGDFGDGFIDIFDVRALFSAAQLGINRPADGTARFSAMDSSTTDNPPDCGGDGFLDIFDVRQCFGVGQLGFDNFTRTGTGDSCMSAAIVQ